MTGRLARHAPSGRHAGHRDYGSAPPPSPERVTDPHGICNAVTRAIRNLEFGIWNAFQVVTKRRSVAVVVGAHELLIPNSKFQILNSCGAQRTTRAW